MTRRLPPCAAALAAAILAAQPALADRVAVLPARGGTDDAARQAAQAEILRGIASLGHTAVPDAEINGILVPDGVADSADEYRTVGTATKAGWVLVALVEPAVQTTRVELIAYHAPTGRVESVAREVEKSRSAPQIREMLGVLLRPEGIGAGELPWERAAPAPQPAAVAGPAPAPAAVAGPAPVAATTAGPEDTGPPEKLVRMDYMLDRHNVWPPYTAGRPLVVSALQGFAFAAIRPEGATGSSASFVGMARVGYGIGDKGLELFAQLGGNLAGPGALWIDAGARFMLTPSVHPIGRTLYGASIHFGLEALAGAFIRPGGGEVTGPDGATYTRPALVDPALGAAATVIIGITPAFQVEAQMGNLRWIPAKGGALLLLGATLGAGLRF